jgi:hypothetical protein
MKWEGLLQRKEVINEHKILVEISQETDPLGISKRRWEDNIKKDLKGTGREVTEVRFASVRCC